MSDPRATYGEPVEEPTPADEGDVVDRANAGLADAEAARRDAAGEPVVVAPEAAPAAADEPVVVASEPAHAEPVVAAPVAEPAASDDDDDARWAVYAASADAPTTVTETSPTAPASDDAPTVVAAPVVPAPVVTPSEPVVTRSEPAADTASLAPASPQPIFVQAPEAPRPRGNRGAAGAIGLLAAVAFAVLLLAGHLVAALIEGTVEVTGLGEAALATLATAGLWVPVAVFFFAFWLLGAIINRGRWGHWVVFGLLVGVAAYGGHLLGALFEAPFWNITASQGEELVAAELLSPLGILAFVLGRELTIWFGAWVSARGARVTELNNEAQREYERTLEAGPQLHRV